MSDDESKLHSGWAEGAGVVLQQMNGGVVNDADLAMKIVEALCESHLGKSDFERQLPFIVADKGTYWRVEGSWNRDGKIEGAGAFFVSIDKRDGRIRDIGSWLHLLPADPQELTRQLSQMSPPEEPE